MTEKRRTRRVTADLTMRVGQLAAARVRDISGAGVGCVTTDRLPLMAVLGIVLELPAGENFIEILCRGIVVRSEALPGNGAPRFGAAILFDGLTREQREAIDAWIALRLGEEAARA